MTITLEHIEAEHSRIAALIEQFKKQPKATEYHVDAATIPLAAGERFAGPILNDDGTLSHYLILLPGQTEDVSWDNAKVWAAKQGGELPTRREQSLLFSNLKHQFDERAYWSCEQYAGNDACAWCQYFDGGSQFYDGRYGTLRARAVRRFIPSVI
jgi:hypothetical protein